MESRFRWNLLTKVLNNNDRLTWNAKGFPEMYMANRKWINQGWEDIEEKK